MPLGRKIEYLSIDELPRVPFVLDGISARFIRENRIVPLELRDDVLNVLIADPDNRAAIDALKVAVATHVKVFTCDEAVIGEYINRFYGKEAQDLNKIIENIGESGLEFIRENEEDAERLKDMASEAPIIQLVNFIIKRAVEGRASDIHIEPYEEELKVRYRIDGILYDIESAPKRLQAAIISRIKIMARLNIAERRLPQDGRIRLRVDEQEIDIRVSSIPVMHGESVVMRVLDRERIVIDLNQLGFPPDTLSDLPSDYHQAPWDHSRNGAYGKRKNDHPLRGPRQDQLPRQEDHHRGGPGGVSDQGNQPDPGEAPDRAEFQQHAAPYRPAGSGYHNDRRDP